MNAARPIEATAERATSTYPEEATLVAELQAGSEEAYGYLLAVYQNPVYNVITHLVANSSEASDVLQEVFVKVFRGIRHFRGHSSLRTWIYRIAVHEASNHRRGWFRRLRHETLSMDEDNHQTDLAQVLRGVRTDTPYEALEQAEREEIVQRALAGLAQPYRAVIVLREIEGLTYEEITEVLGVKEGTVKSRLLRGRELLRKRLEGCLGK